MHVCACTCLHESACKWAHVHVCVLGWLWALTWVGGLVEVLISGRICEAQLGPEQKLVVWVRLEPWELGWYSHLQWERPKEPMGIQGGLQQEGP